MADKCMAIKKTKKLSNIIEIMERKFWNINMPKENIILCVNIEIHSFDAFDGTYMRRRPL